MHLMLLASRVVEIRDVPPFTNFRLKEPVPLVKPENRETGGDVPDFSQNFRRSVISIPVSFFTSRMPGFPKILTHDMLTLQGERKVKCMAAYPVRRNSVSIIEVGDIVRELAPNDKTSEIITAVHHVPAKEAEWVPMPGWIRPEVAEAYRKKGIEQLYSHQAEAAERVHRGDNIVMVTPTASGKTLCYNLPILNSIIDNPDTRALYIFPTKALAQDQLFELQDLGGKLGDTFGVFTYDGDTPSDARQAIRQRGHIVLTNPDMLHTGILPHHTKWTRLFENLQYIVIDELHTYRGVFGSHLANILRRLKRITRFYGANPQFIFCSATIANPGELASRLIDAPVVVLDSNGAPAGERHFLFYNPPMVNKFLGIRRSYINETWRIARGFIHHNLQTMVFTNSRLHTEIILTYLKQDNPIPPGSPEIVRGYRGGYLPTERRDIERGLREGEIRAVVSTNALELGIDIGSLDVVIMAGYPGTIASTWQRAGRAGRRKSGSCAVLVASSRPLDQYIIKHPEYFFSGTPEHAYIQPDNLEILVNHLKCAAFELPLESGETFGSVDLGLLCERLTEAGYLHPSGDFWYWTQESYPADAISLRAVSSDNFVIVDETDRPEVIGEVDFTSALTTVHPKAIYIHNAQQYHVERMDFDQRKAYVKRVAVDYFTQAISYTQVKRLKVDEESTVAGPAMKSYGDVQIRSQVVGFKKIKFYTMENVGSGNLELPEDEMHTTAYWITLSRQLVESLPFAISERQDGLFGLLYALESMASLLLMCDRVDLSAVIGEGAPDLVGADSGWAGASAENEFFEPALYLYDAYPGGIGLSEPLYRLHDILMNRTHELIRGCTCEKGCPSCVGPAGETGERAKEAALAILDRLLCNGSGQEVSNHHELIGR
jgi:DEAD/DEAH box helicase domain-containing protein